MKKVLARIDWPQFIITTFIGTILGYFISKTLANADKGNHPNG